MNSKTNYRNRKDGFYSKKVIIKMTRSPAIVTTSWLRQGTITEVKKIKNAQVQNVFYYESLEYYIL